MRRVITLQDIKNSACAKLNEHLFNDKQEQTEIATYIDAKTSTIDAIINNLQLTINNYYELRKTLINDVVTGKVKVTD